MKRVNYIEKGYLKDTSGDSWIYYLVEEFMNSDKFTVYASTFTGEHKLICDMDKSENEIEIIKNHAEKSIRE